MKGHNRKSFDKTYVHTKGQEKKKLSEFSVGKVTQMSGVIMEKQRKNEKKIPSQLHSFLPRCTVCRLQ